MTYEERLEMRVHALEIAFSALMPIFMADASPQARKALEMVDLDRAIRAAVTAQGPQDALKIQSLHEQTASLLRPTPLAGQEG